MKKKTSIIVIILLTLFILITIGATRIYNSKTYHSRMKTQTLERYTQSKLQSIVDNRVVKEEQIEEQAEQQRIIDEQTQKNDEAYSLVQLKISDETDGFIYNHNATKKYKLASYVDDTEYIFSSILYGTENYDFLSIHNNYGEGIIGRGILDKKSNEIVFMGHTSHGVATSGFIQGITKNNYIIYFKGKVGNYLDNSLEYLNHRTIISSEFELIKYNLKNGEKTVLKNFKCNELLTYSDFKKINYYKECPGQEVLPPKTISINELYNFEFYEVNQYNENHDNT